MLRAGQPRTASNAGNKPARTWKDERKKQSDSEQFSPQRQAVSGGQSVKNLSANIDGQINAVRISFFPGQILVLEEVLQYAFIFSM